MICLASGAAAAVVACGDDGGANKLPDAPLGSDGATPDTPDPTAPARLTITRDGAGVEGVDVYFQNADYSLVAKVPTDANGVAEARVMPGAFVTVRDPFTVAAGIRQDDLRTIAGVQPGDRLVLSQNFGAKPVTFMNVIADADPNGSQYSLWTNCLELNTKGGAPFGMSVGSGSLDRPQVTLDFQCTTTADVLIESGNGSGSSVGWVFVDNAPLTPDGTLDIATAYTASAQVNATFSDIPSEITSVATSTYIATTDGLLWAANNGLGLGSGSASWSFARPAPAGSTQIWVDSMFGGASYGEQQVVDWKPIADPPTFSFANTLLRSFTDGPQFDIASHTVTWSETATGVAPDVAIIEMNAYRDVPNPLAWKWTIAAVPTGASVVYPVLPPDLAGYNAIAGDIPSVFSLKTAKVPGGYNAIRPVALSYDNAVSLVAGATGRIVVQTYVGAILATAPKPTLGQRATTRSR